MKKVLLVVALSLTTAPAWAAKACEELKSEIDTKIQSHGVKTYTLDIVTNDAVGEQKVVGSCDGGTKKIVYKRG